MGHVEVNVFMMVYPGSLFLMTSSVYPSAIVLLLQKFSIQYLFCRIWLVLGICKNNTVK